MVVSKAAPAGALQRVQVETGGGIRLELLGWVRFPEGHRGNLHAHAFWELVHIGGGSGSCLVGGKTVACRAGDLLLFPPGERHRFRADDDAVLDQLYLGFSFDLAVNVAHASVPRMLPPGPFADLLRAEVEAAAGLVRGGSEVERARALLLAVAGRLVGFLQSGARPGVSRSAEASPVKAARELLHADLKGRHGLPELARRFSLSPQYFGEIFKRETGLTVKAFQRECRMLEARRLLASTALSVTEVAAEVGLEDLAYFSRLFKQRFGVSPRRARSAS